MKKKIYLFVSTLVAGITFSACTSDEATTTEKAPVVSEINASGYFTTNKIVVPASVKTVYVEYKTDGGTAAKAVDISSQTAKTKVSSALASSSFNTVSLKVSATNQTNFSVYYKQAGESIYVLEASTTYPEVTSATDLATIASQAGVDASQFGKVRYLSVGWGYAWYNSEATHWQNKPRTDQPDVVVYDSDHNHYMVYRLAYKGDFDAPAYYLVDAYDFTADSDGGLYASEKAGYVVTSETNCQYCMPWGCTCGCGVVRTAFVANGPSVSPDPDPTPTPVVPVEIPSDGKTSTSADAYGNYYHSTGTAFFDTGSDEDYNDAVLDYDIEGRIPSTAELTRGQYPYIKIIIHARAFGDNQIDEAGLDFEGINTDNVMAQDDFNITVGGRNLTDVSATAAEKIKANSTIGAENSTFSMSGLSWLFGDEALATSYTSSKGKNVKFNIDSNANGLYNMELADQNKEGELITLAVMLYPKDVSATNMEDWKTKMNDLITTVSKQKFFITLTDGTKLNYYVLAPTLTKHTPYPNTLSEAYPDFATFVSSTGTEKQDWYNNPDVAKLMPW